MLVIVFFAVLLPGLPSHVGFIHLHNPSKQFFLRRIFLNSPPGCLIKSGMTLLKYSLFCTRNQRHSWLDQKGGQAFYYLIRNESGFFALFSFNQRSDPLTHSPNRISGTAHTLLPQRAIPATPENSHVEIRCLIREITAFPF